MAAANLNDKKTEKQSKKDTFVDVTDEDIDAIIVDSKAKKTNRSTNTSITRLKAFLCHSNLPKIEDVPSEDWPDILKKFYGSLRTKSCGDYYQTSSFKVIRAGLN